MIEARSILLGLTALTIAAILQFGYKLYRIRKRFHDLPGPPHSFLWGHLKVMGEIAATFPPNQHPQAYYTTIAKNYGFEGLFYIDLWPIADPQVILIEPDLMDQVQVRRSFDQHRIANDFLEPFVGPNVIAVANGQVWKQLHRAMAPSFTVSHIRTLTGLMVDESVTFHNTLKRLSAKKQVFSMDGELTKYLIDVVGQVIFNFPLHAQTQGSQYLDDMKTIMRLVNTSVGTLNPLVKLQVFLEKGAVVKRLDQLIREKIYERLDKLRSEKVVPSRREFLSIVDLMLRETLLRDDLGGSTTYAELPPSDLKLLTTKPLLAKQITPRKGPSLTLLNQYIFMLLSRSPEVLLKMRQEHDALFGKTLAETLSTLESTPAKLGELEYTSAVIKESLRLFPIGFVTRQAPAGTTVHYKNRDYPLDDIVISVCWHTMHYDRKYFPDATAFRPERFLNNEVARPWFRSFSRGSRACLGQDFAMDEMRIILLLVSRFFDFHCVGEPNKTPRAPYTDLDMVYGDLVFQELGMEAKPPGGMMMTVTESDYAKQ
ncbi:cytochrome P450 [Xylariales sp. PMI_506]|nr:cytochrome P450 [Xylariales sp. PMI_506]